MAETTSATPTQGPVVGSEEWVKQTLNKKASQIEEIEESLNEPQANAEADVAANEAPSESTPAATAPNWREVPIPADDSEVPQFFRGKPTGELYKGYRELERTFNADREKMRQLEAKLAAKETMEEFLKEARSQQQQPPVPSDPYREAGLDLETDPVLNPTKFFPKQEQVVLDKADKLFEQKLAKYKQEEAQEREKQRQYEIAQRGVATLLQQRGLEAMPEVERKRRIGAVLFQSSFENEQKGPEVIFNPDNLLGIYDSIFPGPPREAAAIPKPPDPPGAKKPAAIESSKPAGPQLKQYQREAMMGAAESLKRAGFTNIDTERFAARYAANLKRMKE